MVSCEDRYDTTLSIDSSYGLARYLVLQIVNSLVVHREGEEIARDLGKRPTTRERLRQRANRSIKEVRRQITPEDHRHRLQQGTPNRSQQHSLAESYDSNEPRE